MKEIRETFRKWDLGFGRMIGFSKTEYRYENPDNKVLFNANIFIEGIGKVWYGDLDLTLSKRALTEIATELNSTLYILSELDGRFENENLEIDVVKSKAKYIVTKDFFIDNLFIKN